MLLKETVHTKLNLDITAASYLRTKNQRKKQHQPNMNGVTAMDENGEDIKSPIKRLGSTRKLLIFNSELTKIIFYLFFRWIARCVHHHTLTGYNFIGRTFFESHSTKF